MIYVGSSNCSLLVRLLSILGLTGPSYSLGLGFHRYSYGSINLYDDLFYEFLGIRLDFAASRLVPQQLTLVTLLG